MKKLLTAVTTCTLLSGVTTLYATEEAAVSKADPEAAATQASKICATCHGADGNSSATTNPKLAGQHEEYLVAAMKSYRKGGNRNSPIKNQIMNSLTDEDIANLAAYYASQDPCKKD